MNGYFDYTQAIVTSIQEEEDEVVKTLKQEMKLVQRIASKEQEVCNKHDMNI